MRYVIGDIHGSFDRMQAVLRLADFDFNKDILYSVGDLCDRGPDCKKTLDWFCENKIKYPNNLEVVFGNHDVWLYQYLNSMIFDVPFEYSAYNCWLNNGARETIKALQGLPLDNLIRYKHLVGDLKPYIELEDCVIQHTPSEVGRLELNLENCVEQNLIDKVYDEGYFSRTMIYASEAIFGSSAEPRSWLKPNNKLLVVGHTPLVKSTVLPVPIYDKKYNFVCIDTGAFATMEEYAVDGCMTLLNLDTMQYFTSDGRTGILKDS